MSNQSKVLTIVSLSGGIDSFATAYDALKRGHDLYVVNFMYNQKHSVEYYSFKNIVEYLETKFPNKIVGVKEIDLGIFLNEVLDDYSKLRDDNIIGEKSNHKYYVPARNLLFSTLLLFVGEIESIKKGYDELYIALGIHKHSKQAYGFVSTNYWDITPEFAIKLSELLKLHNVINVSLFTPFVSKTKSDIVKYLLENDLPYNITWTCYSPIIHKQGSREIYQPCKKCEACIEREIAGKSNNIDNINDYTVVVYNGG